MAVAKISLEQLLTRTECEQILSNLLKDTQHDGELLTYELKPEMEMVGFIGEYFHLHLRYKIKGKNDNIIHECRLFAKTVPYQNAEMCKMCHEIGILKKEVELYKLLNELRHFSDSIWCAKCYYSRDDLFVLQNVVDLGYVGPIDPTGFLSLQQIYALLKALATLHASSIAYELKHNVSIGEQFAEHLKELTIAPHVPWYMAGVKAVLAVALEHPSYQSETMQKYIKEKLPPQLDAVYGMVNSSVKYRNVFCHRDPWGGNVFYKPTSDGEINADISAVLVDFQLCRYSPPAIDVLMALYMNIRPHERKRIFHKGIRYYYDCFASALKAMNIEPELHLSVQQFEASISEFKLQATVYNCICATILRVPGDYLTEMKLNRPKDFHRYTNVERTKEVLELVHTNVGYRAYMFDCIEDLLELISA